MSDSTNTQILILLGDAIGSLPGGVENAVCPDLSKLGLGFEEPVQEAGDRWVGRFRLSPVSQFTRLREHPELKRALHAIFDPLAMDFFLLSESAYFTKKKLVAFDLDSTLIQAEGIDEFARELGVYEKVARITERAMRGEIEFKQSFAERVACLQGLTQTQIEAVRMRTQLSPGVPKLLRAIARYGAQTAILSGGFDPLAELVRRAGPVSRTATNRLEMRDGVCSGGFVPPVIDGQTKASLLRELMTERGLLPDEVIAVGDGSNDIAMLAEAGVGISYRGKPKLNAAADGVLNSDDLSRLEAFLT